MAKNSMIVAVVAIIVVVAAVGAYLLLSDNDEPSGNGITFLVQDDDGVYFWIDGEGETAIDALKDAVDKFDIPFTASTYEGAETGIQSMFGLEMTQDDAGNWFWWTQYIWTGSAWEQANEYMDAYTAENTNNYMALVYGDGTVSVSDLVTPSDAVVWDGSEDGTVFTIESGSGLYFQVNGTGTTVMDAFKAAVDEYKMPFEASKDASGSDTGISSLFGLEMIETEDGAWQYWVQKYLDNGQWVDSYSFMNGINSADFPQFKVVYDTVTFG